MFEWVSYKENYAVYKKSVLCLAEALLNCVIFNKWSHLYLALKMNMIIKCSNGFLSQETTQFIKKLFSVLLRILKCIIFNKRSQLYMHISTMHLKTTRRRVAIKLCPHSYLYHALKKFSSLCWGNVLVVIPCTIPARCRIEYCASWSISPPCA